MSTTALSTAGRFPVRRNAAVLTRPRPEAMIRMAEVGG